MGRESILFKSEEKMTRDEAAKLLHTIADRVADGKVALQQQGNNDIVLQIPQQVEVEIKAEKEEGKRKSKKKIEVEIEWLVEDQTGSAPMNVK